MQATSWRMIASAVKVLPLKKPKTSPRATSSASTVTVTLTSGQTPVAAVTKKLGQSARWAQAR